MQEELPDNDHVVRYCKPTTLNDNKPTYQSFELRKIGRNEKDLSVDWLEFFNKKSTRGKLKFLLETKEMFGYKKSGILAILNENSKLKKEAAINNFSIKIYQTRNSDSHCHLTPSNDLYLSKILSENIQKNYLIKDV